MRLLVVRIAQSKNLPLPVVPRILLNADFLPTPCRRQRRLGSSHSFSDLAVRWGCLAWLRLSVVRVV